MSQIDRLERDLTAWFVETAAPHTPPYLDHILRQTARISQRPRWTYLERFLPMTAATSFRAVTSPVPWRTVGLIAMLLVALLIGALLVGSAPERVPAPFGLARAGLVAYASDGDIFVVDPATNERRSIVSDPAVDRDPQWSRDGTRLVFARGEGPELRLYTVRTDGSRLTAITPAGMPIELDRAGPDYTFSPDGQSVLFVSGTTVQIARTDGSGVTAVRSPNITPREVAWRPTEGAQIAVLGDHAGVYLVTVADGTVETLVPPSPDADAGGVSWSPDGSKLAYNPWSTTIPVFTVQVHVVDVATGLDRIADRSGTAHFWDALGSWSNDGRRLAMVRGYTDGYAKVSVVVMPVDGSGPVVESTKPLAAGGPGITQECCAVIEWAPDDSTILLTPTDPTGQPTGQLIVDPNTGAVTAAPWRGTSDPAWQRLAP